MPNDNLYAPPEADVEVPEVQGLAGRWARLGGAILDSIVAMLVIVPAMFATGYMERAMTGQQAVSDQLIFGGIGMIAFLVLNGYLLANRGQTVGKFLVKTRIVSYEDDNLLPLWKIVGLRYLPIWIMSLIPVVGQLVGLVDALFIFREDKRCVHDLIAGTKVVKA